MHFFWNHSFLWLINTYSSKSQCGSVVIISPVVTLCSLVDSYICIVTVTNVVKRYLIGFFKSYLMKIILLAYFKCAKKTFIYYTEFFNNFWVA